MNEAQAKLKAELLNLNKQIDALQIKVFELEEKCVHCLRPLSEVESADKWMSINACCEVCGKSFGWRCKHSPDGVCHYSCEVFEGQIDLLIKLSDKSTIAAPAIVGGWDDCIYCGMPDERK